MTSRRQFIQSGLTFSTLSLTGVSSMQLAVAAPEGPSFTLGNFIADSRYPESLAAAKELKAQNVPVLEIHGDVTKLWVDHLAVQWKKVPMTLAGVTGTDALFVLETLAWDHGMALVHRQELDRSVPQADGGNVPLTSWIIAPRSMKTIAV